ncbi:hypothetical protein [Parenemella sanctibonifatiensis]|uniref:Uncharacterized protein n=1 Tax=Parenemella sanctibonifatiensis TaxID=2016505 RepID=A0A255EHH9_9ACTN|nr:hypothetical protein [Parenemella sanctibonifatiensis]OYN90700.1 hypothetical protein CGZ92_00695 [Parenemella sanctibonifatiensis]
MTNPAERPPLPPEVVVPINKSTVQGWLTTMWVIGAFAAVVMVLSLLAAVLLESPGLILTGVGLLLTSLAIAINVSTFSEMKKAPFGLRVTHDGFESNAGAQSGWISWDQVKEIKHFSRMGNTAALVVLHDPQGWRAARSGWTRFQTWGNLTLYKCSFAVAPKMLRPVVPGRSNNTMVSQVLQEYHGAWLQRQAARHTALGPQLDAQQFDEQWDAQQSAPSGQSWYSAPDRWQQR